MSIDARHRIGTSRSRKAIGRYVLGLMLLGVCLNAGAQQGFRGFTLTWLPAPIESGAPILFKVQAVTGVASLHGTWMDHDIVFARAGRNNSWYALAGVDVEAAPGLNGLALTETTRDGKEYSETRDVSILAASYKTVPLQVQAKFVEPDAETLKRIDAEKTVKDAAFAHSASRPLWVGDFRAPVPLRATDSFGTRRLFNGKLASVHRGTDFRAHTGTPVLAANDGVVMLARNLFYEGNCVVIDHGQGLMTLYMHLSVLDTHAGASVRKGQRVGLSGATGRATGPHLHFAVRWQGAYLDPVKLLALKLPDDLHADGSKAR